MGGGREMHDTISAYKRQCTPTVECANCQLYGQLIYLERSLCLDSKRTQVCVRVLYVSLTFRLYTHKHIHTDTPTTVHVIHNPSWCRQNSFQSNWIQCCSFAQSRLFSLSPLLCLFIIYLLTCTFNFHIVARVVLKLSNRVKSKSKNKQKTFHRSIFDYRRLKSENRVSVSVCICNERNKFFVGDCKMFCWNLSRESEE